jgi:hypothetical protein
MSLFTINGHLVVTHHEPRISISALAMTNLPVGRAINCIAIGLQNGAIQLVFI